MDEGSQSLRKRQTILAGRNALPPQQAMARRRASGMHAHHYSRQFSGKLNEIPESPDADDATSEKGDTLDKALASPGFDAYSYVSANLKDAGPSEFAKFEEDIRGRLQAMEENEYQKAQQNYDSVRAVARTFSELGPHIAELRRSINELNIVFEAMRQDAETQQHRRMSRHRSVPDRTAEKRQSMLVLNNAWQQDLLALFRKVEGAQKYLPAVPGRHVILESSGWHELNPVTWQPTKQVGLYLLNDHLLTATLARRPVLDQCWDLNSIKLKPIKSGEALQVTFKSTQYVYQNTAKEVREFLSAYSKVAEIVSSARHQRSSVRNAGHQRQISTGSAFSYTSDVPMESQRDAARVMAEIDRVIAYRRYDEAVALILEHQNEELVVETVEARRNQLRDILLKQIDPIDRKSRPEIVQTIEMLSKLGYASQARTTFLDISSKIIAERARSVHFMDDVVGYISQMAVIYFQLVKATIEIYRAAFPNSEESSIVVSWARQEVDKYASVFDRQLYRIPSKTRSYRQCVDVSRRESSQLHQLSMDLEFMLRYVWEG